MLTEIQFEQAIAAFVTFFVLIDAVGVAPIFASLTAPGGSAYARKMAIKAVFVAGLILFFFAFAGAQLLHHLGISLDAFRVAGGVLAAVHHAEVVAHRVGEPFGSLVLAVAVTVIEVALIVTLMLSGGDEAATLARETVFAAVMITVNGILGLSLLLGSRRFGTVRHSLPSGA